MSDRFFDRYPRFYDSTATRLLPNRFQQRWRMIIDQNSEYLRGARVLDLGSHDGRWAFAALQAGAAYVEGIEGRAELVDASNLNFQSYEVDEKRYKFLEGDALECLAKIEPGRFDVVLNLGFFYHTLKHLEILEGMARAGASTLIIDSMVGRSTESLISVSLDTVADPRHAIDHLGLDRATVPVGTVSRTALALLLRSVGYDCEELDWKSVVDDFSECAAYEIGERGTFRARKI